MMTDTEALELRNVKAELRKITFALQLHLPDIGRRCNHSTTRILEEHVKMARAALGENK